MNDNGKAPQHLSIDPLNPPKGWMVLSVIQYPDGKGNIIQDVQCAAMKDLRNEDYCMAMLDSAKLQLGNWFKEQKEIRKLGDKRF